MYVKIMKPYIEYWKGILKCLSKPIPLQSLVFSKGFWLTSNWKVNHVRFLIPSIPIFDDIKNLVILPYCGPKNMKMSLNTTTYTPFRDCFLTHPSKLKMYPVCMGKAHSDVVKDVNDEHYQMVHV